MGLYVSEQFGEESVKYYFLMSKWWFKATVMCCAIFSCCCCCCCCCCFCCGKCKPPEEDENYQYVDPEDLEAQIRAEQDEGGSDVPILIQPSSTVNTSESTHFAASPPMYNTQKMSHQPGPSAVRGPSDRL
ncbi:hypothetical protein DNTS_000648 [Danionella cerebrum]|uniref:Uncharacterized protein n=1 Tax=Danionella cerebrum TaxID=2873325 RepID=A0A553QAJ3_9TELE|nr:hypothetical protein DNTS_000648 [Danionella translucida]